MPLPSLRAQLPKWPKSLATWLPSKHGHWASDTAKCYFLLYQWGKNRFELNAFAIVSSKFANIAEMDSVLRGAAPSGREEQRESLPYPAGCTTTIIRTSRKTYEVACF